MMRNLRLAYYLIADSPEFRALRDETCEPYPEHITIRGRFLAPSSKVADLVVAGREVFRLLAPFTAELHGPRVLENGLAWYELPPDSREYPALRTIHRQLDRTLAGLLAADEVPAEHRGDGYRPHMTVSFRGLDRARLAAAPRRVTVPFVEWGLFRYEESQGRLRLHCLFGEHLYGRAGDASSPLLLPAWS